MTDDRLPLAELAAKSGDTDFLRAIAESVLQLIMEADVDSLIGAGRYEPSSSAPLPAAINEEKTLQITPKAA
jgi:hypothetical protein